MRRNTDWLSDAGWGICVHYLAGNAGGIDQDTGQSVSAQDWNQRVDAFDVVGLAQQVAEVGAGYVLITIGQNSGHYCAPNSVYDSIVEENPSKLSRRDLISDISEALSQQNIGLMVYLPSGAPCNDMNAVEKLGWKWGFTGEEWGSSTTGDRLAGFQRKWESVIREWSVSWGDKIKGWWFDGCYFADDMYRFQDTPNFCSFAEAARVGNAESLVAFNPGVYVPVVSLTDCEDYTAGEIDSAFPKHQGRRVDGAQYHVLSYLGTTWGMGEPRFCDEFVYGFTKDVMLESGAVTWDVMTEYNGLIAAPLFRQLMTLRSLRLVSS